MVQYHIMSRSPWCPKNISLCLRLCICIRICIRICICLCICALFVLRSPWCPQQRISHFVFVFAFVFVFVFVFVFKSHLGSPNKEHLPSWQSGRFHPYWGGELLQSEKISRILGKLNHIDLLVPEKISRLLENQNHVDLLVTTGSPAVEGEQLESTRRHLERGFSLCRNLPKFTKLFY